MENNVCYWVKFQMFIISKVQFYNLSNMQSLKQLIFTLATNIIIQIYKYS
jgi:hypothetical protein